MIADLHGSFPKLPDGDLLIIAGDLTAHDKQVEYRKFAHCLAKLPYKKIIVIAGNHDNLLVKHDECPYRFFNYLDPLVTYLCDSGTEFQGLKIWGSPHSLWFEGINPDCAAFTGNESYLEKLFALIPDDIDILITHSPPHGILDKNKHGFECGSISLRNHMMRVKPKIHIFGHIHEQGSKHIDLATTKLYNASIMDANYKPKNKPITIEDI